MAEPAGPFPRIAINASSMVGPRTGIGRATTELCRALLRHWPEAWPAPLLWINRGRRGPAPDDAWLHQFPPRVRSTCLPGKLLLRGWQYLGWPKIESLTGPIDLFHAPDSYIPSTRAVRRVVTVHDLYFLHAPEDVDTYGGAYFRQTFPHGLAAADAISAVSAFTRDELLRHYNLRPEKIYVVPHGVDHEVYHPIAGPDDEAIRRAFGISGAYLLCVATLEPRKNLKRLIEAYARACRAARTMGLELPTLVVAGGRGWGMQTLEGLAAGMGVAQQVIATGFVDESKLPTLYRGATGLIFPSLYEGFGLPALEAMACGCPTLLARAGSLPEVGGDAAVYLDPLDTESMAPTIAEFFGNASLRDYCRTAGLARCKEFTWDKAGKATLKVYRAALDADSDSKNA